MIILSYIHIIVNIRTLLPFIMYEASYFFDFLINAPYFIQLKGILPDTSLSSTWSGEGPLDLPRYNLLFVDLIKLVYDNLRIYKNIQRSSIILSYTLWLCGDTIMIYGILTNQTCLTLFEKINRRPYCNECQKQRSKFLEKDKKHNSCYSNLLLGECEIAGLAEYYLSESLQKFHQKEIRKLLRTLNDNRKTWVFTDLIKCFVWQGKDKKNNLKASDNKDLAIQKCHIYLDEQIEILRPNNVLSLGRTVTQQYFKLQGKFEHGSIHKCRIKNHTFNMVFSIFPSRNTADLWVANGEWKKILPKLI